MERFGIADQVQRTCYRNKPLLEQDNRRNDAIAVFVLVVNALLAVLKGAMAMHEPVLWDWPKNMVAYGITSGIAATAHNLAKGPSP